MNFHKTPEIKHEIGKFTILLKMYSFSWVNGYHVFIFFRHDTLGFDRAGNKYWFLCRRIFVEEVDWENGNGNIRYYTSVPQFEELMEALDAKYFEADVTAAIEVICWYYIYVFTFWLFFSGQKDFGLSFSKKKL